MKFNSAPRCLPPSSPGHRCGLASATKRAATRQENVAFGVRTAGRLGSPEGDFRRTLNDLNRTGLQSSSAPVRNMSLVVDLYNEVIRVQSSRVHLYAAVEVLASHNLRVSIQASLVDFVNIKQFDICCVRTVMPTFHCSNHALLIASFLRRFWY
jgi:hypothetical protein